MNDAELDKLAAEVYDYCCSFRSDNSKNGEPGDPRKVGENFENLYEQSKNFYRNIVRWHLSKIH